MGFYRIFYYTVGWEYTGTREREQIDKQIYLKYLNCQEINKTDKNIKLTSIDKIKDRQKHLKYTLCKQIEKSYINKSKKEKTNENKPKKEKTNENKLNKEKTNEYKLDAEDIAYTMALYMEGIENLF